MREGVSVTYVTPTQFALLMEFNSEGSSEMFQVQSRPTLLVSGYLSVLPRHSTILGTPATLYHTWSPSELVVQTAISKIDYPEANPVPAGQIGELVVGGVQVGAGYLNRPEANAQSFVEDPFASEDDRTRGWNRMFRRETAAVSDLMANWRDKQIKLRGFRIDLGEVEQVIFKASQSLKKAGALVDIAVVARTVDSDEQQQLIAYLVPKANITNEG
ncbi:hypothetical protein J3459_012240 [Metarhizium acridum]|nr:hypothetical protein J3459_012240 [Metarhizium acridum]